MRVLAKRKKVTPSALDPRLGKQALTRAEARQRAAMAIRRVCGLEPAHT
jgi:hypothetical protein